MSSRSLHDIPLAPWQWRDPLKRFLLIMTIFTWGCLLEICGGQPDYSPELRYLINFGSFVVAIMVGSLAQATFAYTFAYVQGFFLLRKQGIPLQAIMSGEQTPLRVSSACWTILRHSKKRRCSKFYQIISYASILMVYIASVGVGAYAASRLGAPYVFYSTPFKWRQITMDVLIDFGSPNVVQFNSLADWVIKTRGGVSEVAFLPQIYSTSAEAMRIGNLRDADGLVKWKLELQFHNINMRYLSSQCKTDPNPPFDKGSMRLDCSIILKGRLFPLVVMEFPSNEPRDEHKAEVLSRKNELNDLNELKDMLLAAVEEALAVSPNILELDTISANVVKQFAFEWDCEAGNVTCGQLWGASTTVRYVGAILEAASIMYPGADEILDGKQFNLNE